MFLSATLLFTCTGFCVSAQKKAEYVITKKGDTIMCTIKDAFLSSLKYTPVNSTQTEKISTATIKEYYAQTDQNPYVMKKLPDRSKLKFVERLEFGRITLYQLFEQGYTGGMYGGHSVSKVVLYAEKQGNDSLFLIKTSDMFNFVNNRKQRKESFNNMIADDDELVQQFTSSSSYGFDKIRAAVKAYNKKHPLLDK